MREIALEYRRALRWLHAHGEALGFDPERIVVARSSAGAHLAAMTCLRGWADDADQPGGLPAAAVLVSGIYELAPLVGTTSTTPSRSLSRSRPLISPQRHSLSGFPPSVLCCGWPRGPRHEDRDRGLCGDCQTYRSVGVERDVSPMGPSTTRACRWTTASSRAP
ncbi:alpha/beta hydrolase [Variovorax sp. LjRoot175]